MKTYNHFFFLLIKFKKKFPTEIVNIEAIKKNEKIIIIID